MEMNYFERSRELYFAQIALEESQTVNKKLRMKEEVTSGLVSRDVLEQSEGIVNARARSIAAIATLDRRLLTNEKLSSYGILLISDADIDESVSKKIGSGPRSIVFRSSYKDIPVAKKHLLVSELARISTEYLLLQVLGSHPSIPHAFGLIVEGKECSLVESYIEGLSLSRFQFNDSIALGICAVRLIEAVGHIHNRGVIHNNLQPCHVLVKSSLMPVITGFGHACLAPDGYRFSQSRANQLGDGCMQPKFILSGSKPTSVSSDMYCLGQILSQMRLCEESTKIKRIHDWISEFASFCRSHMAGSNPSDNVLFKHAYDLIEILGKIRPDLLR